MMNVDRHKQLDSSHDEVDMDILLNSNEIKLKNQMSYTDGKREFLYV